MVTRRFPITRSDLSTFVPNQRSIRVFEQLFQTSDELEERVTQNEEDIDDLETRVFGPKPRSDIVPFRTVYVDVNGDDSKDGDLLNPLKTIEAGVTLANSISTANVFVAIGAGTYTIQNPFDLPNNTFLVPWDNATWVASPANPAAAVFTVANANADVNLWGGAILGVAGNEIGLDQTGIGSTVFFRDFVMRNLNIGYKVSNGAMICISTELSELDSIVTGYDVSNGASMQVEANNAVDNATATTMFKADGSGTILNIGGVTTVKSTNITTFLDLDNGAASQLLTGVIDGPTTGVRINNGSSLAALGTAFVNTTTDINVLDQNSILRFVGTTLDKNKIIFPAGFKNDNLLFQDNTEDAEATKIYGDLFVGRPERGTDLHSGEGEPYTRGMTVLTTDNTATSTTDGGNFIDVTTAASSPSGSTFSFQGVTANHTILLASTLSDGSSLLKHTGVRIIQTTAAVEVTPRSFVFEYWDGAAWAEIPVMSIEDVNSYRYGNEVFIRASVTEHIRYNADIESPWMLKTINGTNAFWARIRIAITITTAPVFEQFRIHPNSAEFSVDGYERFYGRARYRQTLLSFGNVWGESGGVLDASVPIGSGGIPTGWNHQIKNGQFNGSGDAIYINLTIPRGICTASSLKIRVVYHPEQSGASTDATFLVSVLPIEIQGTLEADPAGGTTPVARTLANTELVTANTAQVTTVSAPAVVPDKLQSFESDPVNISNYYEGDMVAIRVELDATGSANKDFIIWGIELNAVQWSLGERLS